MNNIFDALEICLQELENGADMETVLARFPEHANELRPILNASVKARSMSAPEPSADAVRRGRSRVMQRAAEMRESKIMPRKRVIPAFQRRALSFILAALLLLSGTGLLDASASALPGESLYPVKRSWEGLRLLLIFNQNARSLLEDELEYERLREVNELLIEGRHETIQFAGVFMQVNGMNYVSGIQVILPSGIQIPANGAAVILTGQTNPQGVVEVITLELLPDGSVVPIGNPIDVELESETESGSGSSTESPESSPRYYAMEGTLEAISINTLVINDLTVYLNNARVDGELCVGLRVEVKGYFAEDGRFIVTEVESEGSCSIDSGGGGNDDSNSNSEDDSDSNENSSNSNEENDNNDNGEDNGNHDHSGSNDGDDGGDDSNDSDDD